MDKERLFKNLERRYSSKCELAAHLPLGVDPDAIWEEVLQSRREKGIQLSLSNTNGEAYWYLLTGKMITASEVIVGELMEHDSICEPHINPVSTIEEIYYTGFLEGTQISIKDAMKFLQSGEEPESVEELILLNNRQAASFASENMYHAIDENYLHNLAYFLTDGLDNGGGDFRVTNSIEIPSLQGEMVKLPPANAIPELAAQLSAFLADTKIHPLIKSAAAQAWVLTVRPFPEGNERLARLLSNVILIRAGYTFFGETSISSVIARSSYEYFRAIANILRTENGADLTFFLEYYLTALSAAVNDLRGRREREGQELADEEKKMAVMPLSADIPSDKNKISTVSNMTGTPQKSCKNHNEKRGIILNVLQKFREQGRTQFKIIDIVSLTGIPRKTINTFLNQLVDENTIIAVNRGKPENIYAFPESQNDEAEKSGDIPQETQNPVQNEVLMLAIQKRMQNGTEQSAKIAGLLADYLTSGKYQFTSAEIADTLSVSVFSVRNALNWYKSNHFVKIVGGSRSQYIYAFNTQQDNTENAENTDNQKQYSPELVTLVKSLIHNGNSPKDKRIGKVIFSCMKKGCVTVDDYKKMGLESRLYSDMRFAAQLGLVKRIDMGHYEILVDLADYEGRMEDGMKNTLRLMYELFGEDAFSAEMAIAKLDYSESHISTTLHQLTWLKILNCSKDENRRNSYQFNVNPTDNPEYFEGAA